MQYALKSPCYYALAVALDITLLFMYARQWANCNIGL